MGFPYASMVKNPPANTGDMVLIPGLGRSPGKGNGNPLQYSSQENSMDRGTWWATGPWGHKESDMTQWIDNNNKREHAPMGWALAGALLVVSNSLCNLGQINQSFERILSSVK